MARFILDIGSGLSPCIIKRYIRLGGEPDITTEMMKEMTTPLPGDRYICVCPFADQNTRAAEELASVEAYQGVSVEFLEADGTSMPFENGVADIAFLGDVLSAPRPGAYEDHHAMSPWLDYYIEDDDEFDYDAMPSEMRADMEREFARRATCTVDWLGASESTKIKLVDEALRVLKPDGRLYIGIYQTPCWANQAMDELWRRVNAGELLLTVEYGKHWRLSDNATIYEAVFMKPGAFFGTTLHIPFTPAQEEVFRLWSPIDFR